MASPDSGAPLPQPSSVDTDPSSSFACDYVAGVNRVLSLTPYLLVDNIARNVEMWRFEPGAGEPFARARYDLTSYPNDPDASLLDVDIHAAFLRHGARELLTVNHFGRVRRFDLTTQTAHLQPTGELQLLGDTERVVLAGDSFIGSSPRGEHTDDAARPGLFLFEPIPSSFKAGPARPLAWEQALGDWGVVSALTVSATGTRLAVAAGSRLAVFDLTRGHTGLRLGTCHWERVVPFHCQWIQLDEAGRLWAAGHRLSSAVVSGDWDACRGGALCAWAADTGTREFAVELPDETAWGYGADPVVPAPGWRHIYVLGRDASLHVIDVHSRVTRQLYRPGDADAATPSLGIGHAAIRDEWIYAGFSRGGFCLRRYRLNPA
jgi:hypothetical protein